MELAGGEQREDVKWVSSRNTSSSTGEPSQVPLAPSSSNASSTNYYGDSGGARAAKDEEEPANKRQKNITDEETAVVASSYPSSAAPSSSSQQINVPKNMYCPSLQPPPNSAVVVAAKAVAATLLASTGADGIRPAELEKPVESHVTTVVNTLCLMNPFATIGVRKQHLLHITGRALSAMCFFAVVDYQPCLEGIGINFIDEEARRRGCPESNLKEMRRFIDDTKIYGGDVIVRIDNQVMHTPEKIVFTLNTLQRHWQMAAVTAAKHQPTQPGHISISHKDMTKIVTSIVVLRLTGRSP